LTPVNSPSPVMSYFVPSTPPPMRGRAHSFSQAGSAYHATPYSGYNSLPAPYYNNPGVSRSATYYIAPSVYGGRSRSHSRPRQSHRSHSHHRHGHHRRSRSHQRPSTQPTYRYQTVPSASYSRAPTNYSNSPSLGTRILNFFGLGNGNRYVDQYGRSVDSRGRSKHKY